MRKGSGGTQPQKRKIILGITAAYLLGLILGCVIIWAIPFIKNRADLLQNARDKGNEVLSAGLMDKVMTFGMEHVLYNEQGTVISMQNSFLGRGQWEYIHSFAPKVLETGEYFAPIFLQLDDSDDTPRYVFGIIIGAVVEGPNGRKFASVLLRDLPDLDTSMITYAVIFTFMYGVGLLFSVHTLRKERDLNRMRRDLIANVSHELKTPITAIRAMAEVLHDGMAKDVKSRQLYSGKIIEESDKLEQLVLDILELSRLQSKRTDFKKNKTYADGIIPPVVDRYMMLCGDSGINLDISGLDLKSVPALYTDEDKLIILMNILLDNAVKFTGEGGTIWISNQVGAKSVTFCIRDNGPGIHNEDLRRIFERFYKADTAHNSCGSGLGLAIADEITKGLGEKLWVESKYGVGSAFYFTASYY